MGYESIPHGYETLKKLSFQDCDLEPRAAAEKLLFLAKLEAGRNAYFIIVISSRMNPYDSDKIEKSYENFKLWLYKLPNRSFAMNSEEELNLMLNEYYGNFFKYMTYEQGANDLVSIFPVDSFNNQKWLIDLMTDFILWGDDKVSTISDRVEIFAEALYNNRAIISELAYCYYGTSMHLD